MERLFIWNKIKQLFRLVYRESYCKRQHRRSYTCNLDIADSSILEIITESGDGSSIQLKGLNPGITVVTAASNDAVTTRTVEVLGNSGQCGETATWDLTDGVLTISGTGAITNPAWLQNAGEYYQCCDG